jgi:site-specific recombinase XerD
MMSPLKQKLWPLSRMTASCNVQAVTEAAGIGERAHTWPKGLRHGLGVALNLLQKCLGRAQLGATSIYAKRGEEEE